MKNHSFLIATFAVLLLGACAGVQPRYHTVQRGDTLSALSTRYDVPLDALERVNQDLLVGGLQPGQRLFVPFEERPDWDAPYYAEPLRNVAVADAAISSGAGFLWPVQGRISSRFGSRYMKSRGRHRHEGIDIAAPRGTPVRAARAGKVIYAGNRIPGYGNMVILQHPGQFSTVYAHLTRFKVKKGDTVDRGRVVGTVGRTGRTTGNHLHFEIRSRKRPLDPLPLLYEKYAQNP